MISFHSPTLEDGDWIRSIIASDNCRNDFYSFGNLFLNLVPDASSSDECIKVACHNGRLVILYRDYKSGINYFLYPIGEGDTKTTILEMKDYADSHHFPFLLVLDADHRKEFETAFPSDYKRIPLRDRFDYIYYADKLSTYSGKKLHSKKNFCNRFEREHPNWQFVPLSRKLFPQCMDMLRQWMIDNAARLEPDIQNEHKMIEQAFANFAALRLEGGVLMENGSILGFSIGELVTPDCMTVIFEKAFTSIPGCYSMVCREMTLQSMRNHPSLVYMNREEDLGLEPLRISKLSYHPEFLLEKFSVIGL